MTSQLNELWRRQHITAVSVGFHDMILAVVATPLSVFCGTMAVTCSVSYRPLWKVMQVVVLRHDDPIRGSYQVVLWLLWKVSEVTFQQGVVLCSETHYPACIVSQLSSRTTLS